MRKPALLFALALGASAAFVVACSQSTAHPGPLGDCKNNFGCNEGRGFSTADPGSGNVSAGDAATTGDAARPADASTSTVDAQAQDAPSGG